MRRNTNLRQAGIRTQNLPAGQNDAFQVFNFVHIEYFIIISVSVNIGGSRRGPAGGQSPSATEIILD